MPAVSHPLTDVDAATIVEALGHLPEYRVADLKARLISRHNQGLAEQERLIALGRKAEEAEKAMPPAAPTPEGGDPHGEAQG